MLRPCFSQASLNQCLSTSAILRQAYPWLMWVSSENNFSMRIFLHTLRCHLPQTPTSHGLTTEQDKSIQPSSLSSPLSPLRNTYIKVLLPSPPVLNFSYRQAIINFLNMSFCLGVCFLKDRLKTCAMCMCEEKESKPCSIF